MSHQLGRRDLSLQIPRHFLIIAGCLLVCVNLLLLSISLVTLRHSILPFTIGVTTARVPVSIQVLEPDDSPAAKLTIRFRDRSSQGTVVTTDRNGWAECVVPVLSEREFYGPFCIRQTYDTSEIDVTEVRPNGSRRMLRLVAFSRTDRSMVIVCRRSPKP